MLVGGELHPHHQDSRFSRELDAAWIWEPVKPTCIDAIEPETPLTVTWGRL
jgi:hypothetical protein